MKYRLVHQTIHKYKTPVSVGNHIACLTPRALPWQHATSFELVITPQPATLTERVDYFGNRLTLFTVQQSHHKLTLESRTELHVVNPPKWPEITPAWEQVAEEIRTETSAAGLDAYQFVFESPRIRRRPAFAAYAKQSFTKGRTLADALLELTQRIYKEFRFDAKATHVGTTAEEVLRKKRGVCQDFAHLQVACLRSLNLPARYVSGYIRTYPAPGRPRLVGADASHAWVSVYCPGGGWLDVDPTNNIVPSDGHVTLAWGRDYGDVSPLRGLILGGRHHTLKVGVDLEPLEE
ncbi:MAG TPA: transglutaminase family protein [Bryobacteraceae bacterium]|nr:transglutaminase family protein [Bryobacteraceae bacterium]